MKKILILIVVAAAVFYCDQVTKAAAVESLKNRPPVAVSSVMNLVYVENTGAAFGLFARARGGGRSPLFHVVSLLAIAAIAYLFLRLKEHQTLLTVSLSSILGGALGNFSDRLRLGYVVDFLDAHWGGLHWPAFNIADMAITMGVALLVLDMFLSGEDEDARGGA